MCISNRPLPFNTGHRSPAGPEESPSRGDSAAKSLLWCQFFHFSTVFSITIVPWSPITGGEVNRLAVALGVEGIDIVAYEKTQGARYSSDHESRRSPQPMWAP